MNAISKIIDIHTEDAAFLWLLRDDAVRAPHYDLNDLIELDSRLEANLDGLLVAADNAWPAIQHNLELAEPGEVFVAAWFAINFQDGDKLDEVINAAASTTENRDTLLRALSAAFSWCPLQVIETWLGRFFESGRPFYQFLALTACANHRVDMKAQLEALISSEDSRVSARAIRAAGELGRKELLPKFSCFFTDKNPWKQFWSLWSSCLLGDHSAVPILERLILAPDYPFRKEALNVCARVMEAEKNRSLIRQLAKYHGSERLSIIAAGYTGDPYWIPGLLKFAEQTNTARIAGEAVSMISGLDLAYLDLDRDQPEGYEGGPNEDAGDENVELDPDEDLPWPSPDLLKGWWQQNSFNFQEGRRYLCGKLITPESCYEALRYGYQRQRQAAAYELAFKGYGLYNIKKPGSVQKRDNISFNA